MSEDLLYPSPRRNFLGRLAAGTAALGLTALLPATACAAEKRRRRIGHDDAAASTEPSESPGTLKTKTWPSMRSRSTRVSPRLRLHLHAPLRIGDAVAGDGGHDLRHGGFPLALTDAVWAKYKIGAAMKIMDPSTKAPAERNPFFNPKPGSLEIHDMAIDKLMAKGVLFGACNVALHFLSAKFAPVADVTPEVALKDWTAGSFRGYVDSVRDVGREPRAGSGMLVLRGWRKPVQTR